MGNLAQLSDYAPIDLSSRIVRVKGLGVRAPRSSQFEIKFLVSQSIRIHVGLARLERRDFDAG
jgi:hypothetical protein